MVQDLMGLEPANYAHEIVGFDYGYGPSRGTHSTICLAEEQDARFGDAAHLEQCAPPFRGLNHRDRVMTQPRYVDQAVHGKDWQVG